MAVSIGKFAPTAIVFAAVGYCCWPYLEEKRTHPAAQDAKKLPEIGRAQLSPTIVPATDRDPFGLTLPPKLVNDANDKTKAGTGSIESPVKAKSEPADKAADPAAPAQAEAVPQPVVVKIDTSVLTLNATFLGGARRVAMINSKEYAEGDVLDQTDLQPKPPTITKIFQHRVLLERQGQTAELFYPHSTPKSDDAPNPAPNPAPNARPAVPAAPVAAPAKKKYVNPAFANPKPKLNAPQR